MTHDEKVRDMLDARADQGFDAGISDDIAVADIARILLGAPARETETVR